MGSTFGVGIIGCGWVAGEYVKAFTADPRSEVRALVSRSSARPEACRAQYSLDCTVSSDADAMLARDDIDIVVVSTPHDEHTRYVVAAAQAGKHVIVEKPLALTIEEVRAQQAAVREAGVLSLVGFVLHWNPLLMNIDQLIAQEAFGNIFMVEVDYLHRIWRGPQEWLGTAKQGGTSMLAGGCHGVDALRWFARSEAVEVSAYEVKTENPNEYPGTTTAIVRFESGAIGRSTSCFDAKMPYVFHIGVYGTEGSVRNNQVYAPKLFPGQNGFMTMPCVLPDSGDVAHHPFQGECAHLLDCIESGARPFPDIDNAAKTMEICIAADRSAAGGHPVKIADLG